MRKIALSGLENRKSLQVMRIFSMMHNYLIFDKSKTCWYPSVSAEGNAGAGMIVANVIVY